MKQFWVNLELLEALSLKFRELKWWKTIGRERKINRKKWQKVFSHVNFTAYCRSIILVSHLEFSAPGFDLELIQNLKTAALQSRPLIQTNWRFILRTMANYFEIEPIKDRPKILIGDCIHFVAGTCVSNSSPARVRMIWGKAGPLDCDQGTKTSCRTIPFVWAHLHEIKTSCDIELNVIRTANDHCVT